MEREILIYLTSDAGRIEDLFIVPMESVQHAPSSWRSMSRKLLTRVGKAGAAGLFRLPNGYCFISQYSFKVVEFVYLK